MGREDDGFVSNCNSLDPPLADIVCFCPLCIAVGLTVLKRILGRGFHTLIRNASFPSPTDVGSHNPPLGASVLVGTPSGGWL